MAHSSDDRFGLEPHEEPPDRPRVVDGQVEARSVLDLTVTIDHNVVDGAPAARFGAELRRHLESPGWADDRPHAV